jgi:hypothetical protein
MLSRNLRHLNITLVWDLSPQTAHIFLGFFCFSTVITPSTLVHFNYNKNRIQYQIVPGFLLIMERIAGIEPALLDWKSSTLPLSYIRMVGMEGLEPSWSFLPKILSLVRLPITPHSHYL